MRGVLFERNIDFALAEADVCFGRVKISVIPNAQKSDVFLRQNKVNADVSLRNCQIVADHAPVDFGTIFVIRDETAQLVYVREFQRIGTVVSVGGDFAVFIGPLCFKRVLLMRSSLL